MSKNREKILLYLLPFMFLFLVYLNKKYFYTDTKVSNIDSDILFYTKKINESKKEEQLSDIKIIQLFQTIADSYKTKITTMNFDKKQLHIETAGEFENGINFLQHIEQMSTIKYLKFKNLGKKLGMEIKIDTENVLDKKVVETKNINIHNPYIDKKQKEVIDKNSIGVFGDYILYQGEWITIGDTYKGKKVISITKDEIILKDNHGEETKEWLYEK